MQCPLSLLLLPEGVVVGSLFLLTWSMGSWSWVDEEGVSSGSNMVCQSLLRRSAWSFMLVKRVLAYPRFRLYVTMTVNCLSTYKALSKIDAK